MEVVKKLVRDMESTFRNPTRRRQSNTREAGPDQMFRGNHPTRVDEKGRLKLPAEFKRRDG